MRAAAVRSVICVMTLIWSSAAWADVAAEPWQPAGLRLSTPWTAEVDPSSPLSEYPRPQLVRPTWTNLNGLWEYTIHDRFAGEPTMWDGRILVPFPVESALSGVGRPVRPDQALWYRRAITVAPPTDGQRTLLHFGAVDWQTDVFVNGRLVGSHAGGHTPFTFDVTAALVAGDEQELVLRVWDPTDDASQPRGKQALRPQSIFYTAVTGIWQTVWLETVPAVYIERLLATPDVPGGRVVVTAWAAGEPGDAAVEVRVRAQGEDVARGVGRPGEPIAIALDAPRLWSPDDPFLYDIQATLRSAAGEDRVESYFGLRSIAIRPDEHGVVRLMLNDEPLFHWGLLDQGWWPDGLYTAPTDEALRFDIEMARRMGFNTIRKHVKVEPARWYYWADRLGVLVWQDMPSLMATGAADSIGSGAEHDARVARAARTQFRRELEAMIDALEPFPSVVQWVPFNEGWGQHDTNQVLRWVKQRDPTRLVGGPSGWEDRGFGDTRDIHTYPGPAMAPRMPDRASVLGEFGGLGLPIPGHLWHDGRNWGYRTLRTGDELRLAYEALIPKTRLLIRQGLAAAVFTQATDVEGEVNGLLTYDRRIEKLNPDWLRAMHAQLYLPPTPLRLKTVVATSEREPSAWRYTTQAPDEDWFEPRFDDSGWNIGEAPFGAGRTRDLTPRTVWNTPHIWLRREVEIEQVPAGELYLRLFHDDDVTIYLNGRQVARISGFTTSYELLPLPEALRQVLRPGHHVLAVHCHQHGGGQGVDVGLVVDAADDSAAGQ